MNVVDEGDKFTFIHEHGRATGYLLPNATNCIFISGFYVDHNMRRKGLGDKYHKERLEWMKKQRFITDAFCLVVKGNIAEERIMEKNDWTPVLQGVSSSMTLYHKKIG